MSPVVATYRLAFPVTVAVERDALNRLATCYFRRFATWTALCLMVAIVAWATVVVIVAGTIFSVKTAVMVAIINATLVALALGRSVAAKIALVVVLVALTYVALAIAVA